MTKNVYKILKRQKPDGVRPATAPSSSPRPSSYRADGMDRWTDGRIEVREWSLTTHQR